MKNNFLLKIVIAFVLATFFALCCTELIFAESNIISDESGYDPQHTVLALNMAIVSIQRILNTQDRIVLDQEYKNIISNLKLGNIESDQEIIELYQELMNAISGKVLGYEAAKRLTDIYERWEKEAIKNTLSSLNTDEMNVGTLDIVNPVNMTVKLTAGLAMSCASQYFAYKDKAAEFRRELNQELWRITEDEKKNYNILQTKLLNSSWRLLRQYKLPDEFRIVQKSVDDLFNAVNETDDKKSLTMLRALEGEFRIYPPYWIYRVHLEQKLGNVKEVEKCFNEFNKVWRPVLRNDPYKLEASKYRAQEAMKTGNNLEALKQLDIMCENTLRSDWADNLFAGIAYFALGEKEKGIKRIELNISFGNGKDISNIVLRRMQEGKLDMASLPYELGLLTLEDISKLSYEDLKTLASYGRPDAQFAVGKAMTRGAIIIEVPKDYKNAAELYKKAAYEGYKPAQKILADLYFVGDANFPKNYKQAYIWYYVYGCRSISEEYGFFSRIWQRFYRNFCSLGGLAYKISDWLLDVSSEIREEDDGGFYSTFDLIEGEGLFNFAKLSDAEITEAKTEAQSIIAEIERRKKQTITNNQSGVNPDNPGNVGGGGSGCNIGLGLLTFVSCAVLFLRKVDVEARKHYIKW